MTQEERSHMRYAISLALEWFAELKALGYEPRFDSDVDLLCKIAPQYGVESAKHLQRGIVAAQKQQAAA